MDVSYNSLHVLKERYLQKNDDGKIIETPEDMCMRVAKYIASIDLLYGSTPDEVLVREKEFFDIIDNMKFLPNSPTLMNAGTRLGLFSACFVLPVDDDMESIADAIKMMMIIQKMGGGTGFSFSNLRPEGDYIKSTGGSSSGPISFMEAFNGVTEVIRQGGKRRGANMGILNIHHPDIIKFIYAKINEDDNKLKNFNLSIAITDKFMDALEKNEKYEIINPHNNEVIGKISAYFIWQHLCALSWMNGEPAVVFIDRMNAYNPTPEIGLFESTNPCLTGDTLISTTMGEISIKELAKSRFKKADVYTMKDGKLAITRAINIHATSTKPREILEIVTTRGNIRCTPEHKIYVVNKGWVEAKDLQKGEQLVGLRQARRGTKYIGVGLSIQEKTDNEMEHRLVARYYYGNCINNMDIHHINGDTHDNKITNLQLLPHNIHSQSKMFNNEYYNPIRAISGRFEPTNEHKEKEIINTENKKMAWFVQKINSVGKEIVYDMTVPETENFIANSIVVHNCGEVPLLPYESCNLGSINLGKFIKYNKIEWEELERVTRLAIRFLDNIIDANQFPFKQIEEITKANRKIGLGIMGWADMLIKLNIRYDSDEAVTLGEKVMSFIQQKAKEESIQLAKERGNFPNKDKSIYKNIPYMRNATVTSIAPTGTISIIGDCSYGIEPVFAIITKRNVKDSIGKTLLEINPAVKEIMKKKGYWEEMKKALAAGTCIILPTDIKTLAQTAETIAPEWHVKMQAVFQKNVDNSISKTVNLPESASVEDVMNIYITAYKSGCKGITVYRNNSRKHQLLVANDGACPTCPS